MQNQVAISESSDFHITATPQPLHAAAVHWPAAFLGDNFEYYMFLVTHGSVPPD